MQEKSSLRQHFRQQRLKFKDLSSREREEKVGQLSENLKKVLRSESGVWASYQPHGEEADPRKAVSELTQITWAYPVVCGQDLEFYIPQSEKSFAAGAWGILEPQPELSEQVSLNNIKGFLIPGVAFDQKGHRLGQGKGYYDRILKNYSGAKVGVAWEAQKSAQDLPVEAHDVCMDHVVTESSVWSAQAVA